VSGTPLLERRLVFVLGKGGVGKSVVSAALATAWARAGRRTLLVEVQGQHRLSELFEARSVGPSRETELAPNLHGVSIDVERSTEEYIASQLRMGPLVDLLVRSRAFHNFAAAAPGLAELVTLGKIWDLAVALHDGRPVWDRLVVDCPATGHGIALLETAGNVGSLASQGPVAEQAGRIQEVVTHPAATGIVVVARPEELPVTEAAEAVATLRADGFPVAATVLNMVSGTRFTAADAAPLEAVAAGGGAEAAAAGHALSALRRGAVERAHREELVAATGMEPIDLPDLGPEGAGRDALGTLADAIESALAGAPRTVVGA
jgi:anion-transporting  ArsA/GET3 family ATPase